MSLDLISLGLVTYFNLHASYINLPLKIGKHTKGMSLACRYGLYNIYMAKSQITKISKSEENSKQKIRNQMAKSKAQTHQTNG